jgi:hypothetical protein
MAFSLVKSSQLEPIGDGEGLVDVGRGNRKGAVVGDGVLGVIADIVGRSDGVCVGPLVEMGGFVGAVSGGLD